MAAPRSCSATGRPGTPAPSGPPPGRRLAGDGSGWTYRQRLRGAVAAMLAGVAVVRDLSSALDLVATRPQRRAVTADGDLVGAGWVSGSDRKPSTLEITSEVEKARAELAGPRSRAAS